MTRPAPSEYSAGYTLLELLVVMALLSLLLTVLSGTLFLGINARSRITAVTADNTDFAAFRRILYWELGRAYPGYAYGSGSPTIKFSGSSDDVAFLAPNLESQGVGLSAFELSLKKDSSHAEVDLSAIRDIGVSEPTTVAQFASGAVALKIRYYGEDLQSGHGESEWQNDWTGRDVLPDLVAIKVSFAANDHRAWPEIIIHPSIGGDVTCQIDPTTRRCVGR